VYVLEQKVGFGGFGHNFMDGNSTMSRLERIRDVIHVPEGALKIGQW